MLRFFSLLFAVLGVAAVFLLVTKLRKVEPAPPPLVEPARAPFADNIGARGIVESVNENVRIAPAISGLVTKVNVGVGDKVEEGDVLLEQDSRDARALIEIEEAQIETLRAQIAEAEVTLADRRDQWARIEKLSQEKVASIDERQRVKFANDAAISAIERARKQLAAAEKLAQRTRVQLDLLSVKAPRRGTVLQVNVRSGEYASIAATEPLMLLGQIDQFQLRADVDEDNASRVREGCRAIAYIKGSAKDPIPLKFVRIEPYILPKRSLTGESSERVDTRVLQIIFRFERPETPVYVGQQMDVFLEAGEPGAKAAKP